MSKDAIQKGDVEGKRMLSAMDEEWMKKKRREERDEKRLMKGNEE